MEPVTEYVRPSPDEWQKVRDLRVSAVTEQPRAFGRTPEEEMAAPESIWRERLEKKTYLLAKQGEKFVGMVSFVPNHNEKTKHIINIYSVYVVPQARGKGIARTLLTKAMTEAREMFPTIAKFSLTVATTQPEAQKLYESLGFEKVGFLKKEMLVDGDFVDEIVLENYLINP